MSFNQREDFTGRIAKRIKLAEEKDLPIFQTISIIGKKDEKEIDEYFAKINNKPIIQEKETRESILDILS